MSIQTDNYFDLFALTPTYTIDRKVLDKAYHQLQLVSHPDKFINQSSEFQRRAVQQTAQNIEAYQTLKSPVRRACHLLSVLGIPFELSNYTVSDIDLLMQQMEYREQLSAIKELADFDKLQSFATLLDGVTKVTVDKITVLFAQAIAKNSLDKLAMDIKNNICELQFLTKLAVDLDGVEEQLLLLQ